jgi:2'-5' RNA ligase
MSEKRTYYVHIPVSGVIADQIKISQQQISNTIDTAGLKLPKPHITIKSPVKLTDVQANKLQLRLQELGDTTSQFDLNFGGVKTFEHEDHEEKTLYVSTFITSRLYTLAKNVKQIVSEISGEESGEFETRALYHSTIVSGDIPDSFSTITEDAKDLLGTQLYTGVAESIELLRKSTDTKKWEVLQTIRLQK